VVPYQALAPDTVAAIARRAIARALGREGFVRRGVAVRYDEAVVERVARLGFDARYGARPLNRAIERWLVVPLARVLAARGAGAPPVLEVVVRGDAVAVAPSSPHEVAALDEATVRAELARRVEQKPRTSATLTLTPADRSARRWAWWLAERYRAWGDRHGASVELVEPVDEHAVLRITLGGAAASLLACEAGPHEFVIGDESARVNVASDGAGAGQGARLYREAPVASILDGETGHEEVGPWEHALRPEALDRFVLARLLRAS
jgi:hypothetical protein